MTNEEIAMIREKAQKAFNKELNRVLDEAVIKALGGKLKD